MIHLEIPLLMSLSMNLYMLQPLPKSKKSSNKGNKKERNSSGTTRKSKQTKCPEILSDESSSDEDEKKNKEESSEDEEKESEEEVKCCFKLLFSTRKIFYNRLELNAKSKMLKVVIFSQTFWELFTKCNSI